MLDIRQLLENPDDTIKRLKARDPGIDLGHLPELDSRRRELIARVESLKSEKNKASREIGIRKQTGDDAADLLATVADLGEKISEGESVLKKIETEIREFLEIIPNIPIDPTPMVPDKSGNRIVRSWGEAVKAENWPFKFRNHLEVAEKLGVNGGLDFHRAAKMTGNNWPMYRGDLACLEWAVVQFLIHEAVAAGRELIIPPYLVNSQSMFASGQFPKFRDQAYECADDDLVLLPTSEVALLNLYRDEILPGDSLPVRLASFTPCFRREAGTYGKEERGLVRLHQFHKVEIFSFVKAEDALDELELMTRHAELLVQKLGLPYQVSLLAAGDLAQQSACTYDVEAWLPGQDKFSEVSSISQCGDYQSRRASIRYKPGPKAKPEFVHSLNGSALATSRVMVSILEHYQEEDGCLRVPDVLKPYMGGIEVIKAVK